MNKELLEKLDKTSSEIENILNTLVDDYDKIGKGGNIWTGEAANIAKDTFETLSAKYSMYNKGIKKYIEKVGNNNE